MRTDYVVVGANIERGRQRGWKVAIREGAVIDHVLLKSRDLDEACAEAAALVADTGRTVWCPARGEPYPEEP